MTRFLSWEDVCEMPPPEWLIEGYQPVDALSCIYGPPGVGKSFLALDQALCVATGTPWMGYPVKQGPVIYIAAEGSRGLGKRMEAWREFRDLPKSPDFFVLGEAVQLLRDDQLEGLVRGIEALKKPPVLIVIDTFSRCLVGGNENSQQDVGSAVAAMNRIQRCCGATILPLHHTGWNGEHERGSTVLPGALDTSAHLKTDQQGKGLILECKKQKDWEAFAPMGIKLIPFAGSLVPVRSDIDPLAGIGPIYWLMLGNLLPYLEGEGASRKFLMDKCGIPHSTFRDQWNKFKAAGFVQKTGGKRGLYTITDEGRRGLDTHFDRMREDKGHE